MLFRSVVSYSLLLTSRNPYFQISDILYYLFLGLSKIFIIYNSSIIYSIISAHPTLSHFYTILLKLDLFNPTNSS